MRRTLSISLGPHIQVQRHNVSGFEKAAHFAASAVYEICATPSQSRSFNCVVILLS